MEPSQQKIFEAGLKRENYGESPSQEFKMMGHKLL
jgi:hypothetical protein